MLLAPAASIQAVLFKIAKQPKLSAIFTRSVAVVNLIAVVAAVVPRLEITQLVNDNPAIAWALAELVTILTKFKTLLISRNSQESIEKSCGPVVIVPDAKVWLKLTTYTPMPPVVPEVCDWILVPGIIPVPMTAAPGYNVPLPTAVTVIVVEAIEAVTLALMPVNTEATSAKLQRNKQF